MMEKFMDDAREYERRHTESWYGRAWSPSAGAGMALEPLSPTGLYDMVQNPSLFNLMKLGYVPALNFAGATAAGWVVGEKITFTHRLLHSLDMTYRAYRWGIMTTGRAVGSAALFAVRRTPGAILSAGLVGAGLWLQDLYHDLSGSYIGDIRFVR
jgi:hypothetical protein